ncbi:MAG: triose-phosphate isomerase [Bacteroidales bacterium]|nr:triose-phosphate isomerase [Bacteroidales bacterium]MCF8388252.1 triose-phosphate isomerase [Bacteroidales bacterium]MCF8398499.1 triose-phosphate isomerase [Bacteroidales bacterium]
MRKNIVAGNWKMNKTFQQAEELVAEVKDLMEEHEIKHTEVIVIPPFPYLEMATDLAQGSPLKVGAQNVSDHDYGAYTGEISAPMLASMEVNYCIVGHSERRKYFREKSKALAEKVKQLLNAGITPIFCCGEDLEKREKGQQEKVVERQISKALFELEPDDFSRMVIAYEPVWAIGTGKNATPEQAQEMHAFIRKIIEGKYGKDISENISILYGGSCNAKNAKSLFKNPDVDGGLIGGASLNAEEFLKVIRGIPA